MTVLFGQNDVKYVWRKKEKLAVREKQFLMIENVTGLFSTSGVGTLHRMKVIMRKETWTERVVST